MRRQIRALGPCKPRTFSLKIKAIHCWASRNRNASLCINQWEQRHRRHSKLLLTFFTSKGLDLICNDKGSLVNCSSKEHTQAYTIWTNWVNKRWSLRKETDFMHFPPSYVKQMFHFQHIVLIYVFYWLPLCCLFSLSPVYSASQIHAECAQIANRNACPPTHKCTYTLL